MTSAGAWLWEPLGGVLPSRTASLHRTVPVTVRHSVGRAGGPSHPGVNSAFGCRLAMFSRGTRPLYHGIVQVIEGIGVQIPTLSLAGILCLLREVIMLVPSLSCALLRSTMRQWHGVGW